MDQTTNSRRRNPNNKQANIIIHYSTRRTFESDRLEGVTLQKLKILNYEPGNVISELKEYISEWRAYEYSIYLFIFGPHPPRFRRNLQCVYIYLFAEVSYYIVEYNVSRFGFLASCFSWEAKIRHQDRDWGMNIAVQLPKVVLYSQRGPILESQFHLRAVLWPGWIRRSFPTVASLNYRVIGTSTLWYTVCV